MTADLLASSHPVLAALLYVAAGLYVLAFAASLVRPAAGRYIVGVGLAAHLAGLIGRGWVIGYFPLTNKMESFSAAAAAMAIVAIIAWRPSRSFVVALLVLIGAATAASLSFSLDLVYAPPLLRTIWYPLHVPLSFLAYGAWAAAAAAATSWLIERDGEWLALVDRLALVGFMLWSLAMITGGIWGVVAWGSYFLWDPKVVWSVILWLHYASLLHLRLTPSLRQQVWVGPALALVGLAFVFVAYVGTSFLFGRSSHAF